MKSSKWFFAGIFFLSLTYFPAGVQADPAKVLVKSPTGEVSLERSDELSEVIDGMELQLKDRVFTGPDGQVDIIWNKMWGYRLLGSTDCVLRATEKKNTIIEIKEGNMVVNVKELPESGEFRLTTPTAVLAVRGTQFWGRVMPVLGEPKVTFAVRQGSVEIMLKSNGYTFTLNRGQAVDITEDVATVEPRVALPEEMAAMAQAEDILPSA